MSSIRRFETSPRSSKGVVHNGIVYLGGTTAGDYSLDIRGQTKQTLTEIERLLVDAGTDKSRLLTAQIWLKDIVRDFSAMNEMWDSWTVPGEAPTRATAQCEMAAPEVLIEIIVTAAAAASGS
ncbi:MULTISPECIES: RidA family protein [unclassified Mesorhizobium]|uniref:RidA family protein n=1 Tax=unclassified Mesorhizobium TaxID=325217 RepID=UPI001FED6A3A|nr:MULTISPECIES: RidA family protein [unclassified Mesorhizobium]